MEVLGRGLKLSRVRSSGISSPELVDFILEGRAGSSFRRVECSMGGIWQLEDLRGKPWSLRCLQGLTPGVRLAATHLHLLPYSTWVTCGCWNPKSNLRRCGLIDGAVSLGVDSEASIQKPMPLPVSLLCCQLSAAPVPCLLPAPCHEGHGLEPSTTVSPNNPS